MEKINENRFELKLDNLTSNQFLKISTFINNEIIGKDEVDSSKKEPKKVTTKKAKVTKVVEEAPKKVTEVVEEAPKKVTEVVEEAPKEDDFDSIMDDVLGEEPTNTITTKEEDTAEPNITEEFNSDELSFDDLDDLI